jgi:Competence protein CoiA-like family
MTAALRELAHALGGDVEIVTPLHRGRSAVKIPFGRDANGKMVSIDAVIRGLACQCFCSACNAPLIARKGEKNQHHFAHYVETENCAEARETALHKFAKELICRSSLTRRVYTPLFACQTILTSARCKTQSLSNGLMVFDQMSWLNLLNLWR